MSSIVQFYTFFRIFKVKNMRFYKEDLIYLIVGNLE